MPHSLLTSLTPPSLPLSHFASLTSRLSYSSLPLVHFLTHFLPLLLLPPFLLFITSLTSWFSYSPFFPQSLSFIASLTPCLLLLPPSHSLSHSFPASLTPCSLLLIHSHSLPASLTPPSLPLIHCLTHFLPLLLLPPSLLFIISLTSCLLLLPSSHSLSHSLPASLTPPSLLFITSLTPCFSYSSLPPSHSLSHSIPASLTPPSLSFIISLVLPLLLLPPSLLFITSLISCLSYSSLHPLSLSLSLNLSFFLMNFHQLIPFWHSRNHSNTYSERCNQLTFDWPSCQSNCSGVSSSTHTTQCVHIEILINHFWTFTTKCSLRRT